MREKSIITSAGAEHIDGLVCGYSRKLRESRCLVVLQGFADDSGSGRGKGQGNIFALAGFISPAADWKLFSDEWEEVCNCDPKTPDFHMAEAYRIKGKYRWKDEDQRDDKLTKLVSVLRHHAGYRVDSVLKREHYEQFVRGKLPPMIDDPYFICFYNVVLSACHLLNKIQAVGTVDWIFDEQGKIGREAVEWYYWVREHAPPKVRARLGVTPTFRDDNEILPLKAADMFAWQIRRHLNEEQPKGKTHGDALDTLMQMYGVSCRFRSEDLSGLVQSGGVLLKADCGFRL
jgi:hypothetical protein